MKRQKHGFLTLVAYGFPAFVTSFPLVPFAVYLPAYYAEDKQLGYIAVGIALFLSRLIDVISDPIVGYLSDRFSLLNKRRQGWMVFGAAIAALALFFITRPPEIVSVIYLGAWSAVLYIGWTMVMVPYMALAADLAKSYAENTRYVMFREVFSLFGTLFAISLPFLMEGAALENITTVAFPVGLIAFLGVWYLVPTPKFDAANSSVSYEDIKNILQVPFTRRLCLVWFLTATASAVPAALFPVYVTEVLEGSDTEQAFVIFIYFIAAVLGMPFFSWVAKTYLKHKVMAVGMLAVSIIFPAAIFMSPGDVTGFAIVCFLTGFALAAELLLGPSMLADASELYSKKYGSRFAALHFAIWGVISKIAFAVAILLAFGVLEVLSSFLNGSAYAFAVAVLYAGLPALIKLPTVRLLYTAPFTIKDRDLVQC
ncbi:MFS transporter [Kordiimonas sp. SCSIO 12603]|uniref:MFS transporter n=1 Tax=Kordiimonas sp. SCSIO 12603 TaxID=2829596 RepID=UPI0021046207|nr:MFS transporter [Kordiimonas sp. SCSIO 12603]UTW57828.1 MFS transporter [Kordiimonas sp. SCSIO 12603]